MNFWNVICKWRKVRTKRHHLVWALAILALLCLLGAFSAEAASPAGTVVAWGDNSRNQTTVPVGLVDVVAIASGGSQSLALKGDGTIVGWGKYIDTSVFGQPYTPTYVPNVTDAVGVAAGDSIAVVLRSNGTVIAWGGNFYGETEGAYGLANVTAIAAGGYHGLALKADHTVAGWGADSYGQATPPQGLINVVAIAAGKFHSVALKGDGTVAAWGYPWSGVTNVPQGLNNVVAIAAGSYDTLALKSDGTFVGWGEDYYGEANAPLGLSNVVALAGGYYHSLALTAGGGVVAWGCNPYGQCNVPSQLTNAVAIACGSNFSLAISLAPAIWGTQPSVELAGRVSTNLTPSLWSGSPFTCQWFFNGSPITNTATNLAIIGFSLAQAGAYGTAISNQYGSATATTVLRLINSPVVLVDGVDVGGGEVDRVASAQIAMSSSFGANAYIYYTLDESEPNFAATPYYDAFRLTNSATIRAISYNSNYTGWAEAASIYVHIWPTYPLSASTAGGGSVSVSPAAYNGGNRYVSNTIVSLSAVASNGWSFIRWAGDSTDANSTTTILMNRSRSVQAVFGTSLNLFTNGNGQLLINPASGPYSFGSAVQLTALPAAGSYFFGWAGAASGFLNPLFTTATNATGITALFAALSANQVSLTVLPNNNGSVLVNPSSSVYTSGETVTLMAVPAANNVFTGWSGGASGNLNPLGITLTTSTVITANFAPGSPTNLPVITQQPLSRTLSAGASTVLSFHTSGDGPFSYQWRFNASPISEGTHATLVLTNVTPAQAGIYDVVVTGVAGTVTSAVASVSLFGLELASSWTGSVPFLTLDGAEGTRYRLEFLEDLSQTNWILLSPVVMENNWFFYVDEPVTNHSKRFYRAVPQ